MGLTGIIRYPSSESPSWDAVRLALSQLGVTPSIVMIDGLPAFPDEIPEPAWQELRLGSDAGMITIHRENSSIRCVIWENANPNLQDFWTKTIWASAAAGEGIIDTSTGPMTAVEFAHFNNLSPK
jgi:hypothetical protein